jgi:hypothetical protein
VRLRHVLSAVLLGSLCFAAGASADGLIKAYGWGVVDGASQFETCTSTCEAGISGSGVGQLDHPGGIAIGLSGNVYVLEDNRIDEFSAAGAFIKAFGWGVSNGATQFETCTSSCQAGIAGSGAGQLDAAGPGSIATDPSGNVYVADELNQRIDEFSAAGAFIEAYGWGVNGGSGFETCTSTCQAGTSGAGAGELSYPDTIATDAAGDVYETGSNNNRIDEFSAAGAFIKAFGWGVSDHNNQFETCASTCLGGIGGAGAGEISNFPQGLAVDPSGNLYLADNANNRIDEFSAAGAFLKAYGWGVSDGASQFETCTTTCEIGLSGGGAGQADGIYGIATDPAGDLYVANDGAQRIDEFSAAGAFIKAFGWGVSDGTSQFETCTGTCRAGISGGGPGQLAYPLGIATDSSGNVYVADEYNNRIDEFGGSFAPAATTVDDAASNSPWGGTETTGASAYDTATVSGVNGAVPTGTVTYSFFTNGSCSETAASTDQVALSNGDVPDSSATGPLAAGSYSFQAAYSGDGTYQPLASSCEPFTVLGGSSGGGGGSGPPPAAAASAANPSTSGETAGIVVSCAGATGETCTITLSLRVTETLRGGKVIAVAASKKPKTTKRTLSLGTASATLNTGESETLHVTLNATGRSLLKSRHKLAVKLTATNGTSVLESQTVTFKQAPPKKKG